MDSVKLAVQLVEQGMFYSSCPVYVCICHAAGLAVPCVVGELDNAVPFFDCQVCLPLQLCRVVEDFCRAVEDFSMFFVVVHHVFYCWSFS